MLNVFVFLLPLRVQLLVTGDLAQLVEGLLSMHEPWIGFPALYRGGCGGACP